MRGKPGRKFKTHQERINDHTDTSDPNGCWHWGGALDRDGYGVAFRGLAHRHAYEHAYGPIPEGLQIDHLCRTRDCVNPAHLEAVTPRVNILRSDAWSGVNARKTHCPQNHPYDETNTYISPQGARQCRACQRRRVAEYKARKKAAA